MRQTGPFCSKRSGGRTVQPNWTFPGVTCKTSALYLKRDRERLVWELERRETELHKEPPDPVLEAVAVLATVEWPKWSGTAADLAVALERKMKANALAMRLNVRAERLSYEYPIRYKDDRTHVGRSIFLTLETHWM
ncbi:hypothetical protein [Anaeromassilibacillus sp. SJQ-1]|uniref:hypothetical protein n=1 Tax=Anaeromassilibacillus sp. SJQ-1 TaxID=3375419 RepID=UPI0039891F7F